MVAISDVPASLNGGIHPQMQKLYLLFTIVDVGTELFRGVSRSCHKNGFGRENQRMGAL